MKIVKVIIAAVCFVAAVFLATANMHEVALFFPDIPASGWPHAVSIQVPLFVVILVTLVIGVLIAGLGTLFEQVRLRAVARRARKTRDRALTAQTAAEQERSQATQELENVRIELETAQTERDDARRELETLRGEVDELRRAGRQVEPEPSADPIVVTESEGGS